MAESEPQEGNTIKIVEDLSSNLEKLLDKTENLTVSVGFVVQATWMAYDMVIMRTNPDLANSMRCLENAFLTCKEELEKKWQEVPDESKGEEQKKE